MKTLRTFTLYISLLVMFILFSCFSLQAQETQTLEGTMWETTTFSTSMMGGIQISTADLTFSNGELTVSDWIYNLDPGAYKEYPKGSSISFTATLQNGNTFPPQIFLIVGTATDGKIAGVMYNPQSGTMMNKNYFLFWGEPMPMSQ